ncbi:TAXI family TRAP transporter solute-binding subunit [Saccharothrix violaceirubra]|uniref:TRAP transporter TAXI family solute receptor n=1 Tax=Saccharothrix violaceirubra TaxID=413306 RepID=A0A7W7WXP3_9PSEU|nr:TAXI family TRAP transporter solute-binding subunit [Saccharothrix violaceirubra]MBB4967654.1 hypothetical protein [Saccharothrix violaceirubra]
MSGLLRARVLGIALALVVLSATACSVDFSTVRLTIAAGGTAGEYYALGKALATEWERSPGVARPAVDVTDGAVDNLGRLRTNRAQVGFAQADAAAAIGTAQVMAGEHRLYALARMHDDYFQLVVRADLPVHKLADLRGLRVSTGAAVSGTRFIAELLLDVAGIDPDTDLQVRHLDLESGKNAMVAGTLDAFFWSGGVPTKTITDLAGVVGLRLVDLADVVPRMVERHPVYGWATLPASSYPIPGGAIKTLVVRNFLMVNDTVSDDLAEALTRGLFAAQRTLAEVSPAARSLDTRSAIETTPIPLHPGATRYYRDVKV